MTHQFCQAFDFSYMRNGNHLSTPNIDEQKLLMPYQRQFDHTESKAILLLHGFSSSPAVFRHFYPHLCHYRYIYAPTLRGHGQSIQNFSQATAQDWLLQVEDILTELCQHFETVDVLGLSLGGLLAAYLCPKFPIHHLYLLAPALALCSPISLLQQTAKIAKNLGFFALRNRGGCVYQSDESELAYRWLPVNTVLEILELIQNYPEHSWNTPSTVFLGRKDPVVDSSKVAQKLQTHPNLRTVILEQSAHVLPIDGNYRDILQMINFHNVAEPEHKTLSTLSNQAPLHDPS
jgi:carboxylesterase